MAIKELLGTEIKELVRLKELLCLKKTLRFNAQGKFRILFLSDLHGGFGQSAQLAEAIEAMVAFTAPDLVMLNGDTAGCGPIHVETAEQVREMLETDTAPMTKRGIPWAHTFGNHDNNYGVSKEEQEEIYESFPLCLSKAGEASLPGVANYCLPILAHDSDIIAFNLWAMDSHDNVSRFAQRLGLPEKTKLELSRMHGSSGYDTVRFEQIMWYYNTSKLLEAYNDAKIPGLMLMHIALPEHEIVAENRVACGYEGEQYEDVAFTCLNSGLFGACLERGDIKMILAGHDHYNDFIGTYGGIQLGYVGSLTYDGYQRDDLRGARVVELDESGAMNTRLIRLRSILGEKADKR